MRAQRASKSLTDHADVRVDLERFRLAAASSVLGNQTTTVYRWIGGHPTRVYTRRVIDLSRFAGKTITLRWVSTEDAGQQTDILIDDVSLCTR